MNSFSDLLKKEHMGQLALVILFIIYLIMGYRTPQTIAVAVDSVVGKIVVFLVVAYLFMHANPILAVLSVFVAFDLLRRSSFATGSGPLLMYMPSESQKSSQFTAFNQFPYTLEQEVVKKMAPIVQGGSPLTKASYKPVMDKLYDAAPLH
jgi:hypothetical protein